MAVKENVGDSEEFVTAWESSSSIDEVAEKTGMTKRKVVAKASYLRSLGVGLTFYQPGRKKIDAAALNKLIEAMTGREVKLPPAKDPIEQVRNKSEEDLRAEHDARQKRVAASLRRLIGKNKGASKD